MKTDQQFDRRLLAISFTGLYGNERKVGKLIVDQLGGAYNGALQPSVTSVLVCPDAAAIEPDSAHSEKVALAIEEGIPIVRYQWLECSAAKGCFIDHVPFLAASSSLAPRSSATRSPLLPSSEKLRAESQVTAEGAAFRNILNPLWGSTPPPIAACDLRRSAAAGGGVGGLPALKEHVAELLDTPPLPPPTTDALLPSLAAPRGCAQGAAAATARLAQQRCQHRSSGGSPLEDSLRGLRLQEQQGGQPSSPQSSNASVNQLAAPSQQLSPSPAAMCAIPMAHVHTGAPLGRAPSPAAMEALQAHHGRGTAQGAVFYSSATVHAASGALLFTPGATSQGAVMLYDVDNAGVRCFARVLVRSIYTLPSLGGEVWMQHHYLFSQAEEQEYRARHGTEGDADWVAALSAGAAAAAAAAAAAEELSMSASWAYHSPMHLITDALKVCFPGAAGRRAGFQCRRGFDPTTGASAALKRALAGLST